MKYQCVSCNNLDTDDLNIVGFHMREFPNHQYRINFKGWTRPQSIPINKIYLTPTTQTTLSQGFVPKTKVMKEVRNP
jgi:hypothetical protein